MAAGAGAPTHSIQGLLTSQRSQTTSTANLGLKNDSLSYLRIIRELAPVLDGQESGKEFLDVSAKDFDKLQKEKSMKSLR